MIRNVCMCLSPDNLTSGTTNGKVVDLAGTVASVIADTFKLVQQLRRKLSAHK